MDSNSVVLYLMTQKGFDSLNALIKNNYKEFIKEVIVSIDKNVVNDYSLDIFNLCLNNGIRVSYRTENKIQNNCIKLAIGWRWFIQNTFEIKNLYVLHDSILPKYRGFAPLVNQLINGEKIIGATLFLASNTYDEGDIIFQKKIAINYPIKIQTAINLISNIYCDLTLKLFESIKNNQKIPKKKQIEKNASYSLWRDSYDYRINWKNDADTIHRFINALSSPFLGAYTYVDDIKILITEAQIVNDCKIENRDNGKVIKIENGKPLVVCQTGILKILEAFDFTTGKSILPIKKFRSRFV